MHGVVPFWVPMFTLLTTRNTLWGKFPTDNILHALYILSISPDNRGYKNYNATNKKMQKCISPSVLDTSYT